MSYVPMKPDELKKMVLMGKRRPMNFAYNPGPKEQDLMIIDRIKAPEVLGRIAKKEGTGAKVAAGVFEIDAKKFTIKVPKELPGLAKKLRKYLKKMDLSFSVIVLDSNDTIVESDMADEDQQDGTQQDGPDESSENQPLQQETQEAPQQTGKPETETETETVSPEQQQAAKVQRSELTERLRKLQSPISDLGAAGASLGKAAAAVIALLKAGSLDKAEDTLAKIEAGLVKVQASTQDKSETAEAPVAPVAKALMARATSLRTAMDSLQGADVDAVKPLLVQGLAALQEKDWAIADARIAEAEKAVNTLAKAPAAPQSTADTNAPADPEQSAEQTAQTPSTSSPEAQQKWEAMADKIQAGVDKVMQGKTGDLEGIKRTFDVAKSKAEAGDYDSAIAAVTDTVVLLKAATTAPAAQGEAYAQKASDTTSDNLAAYRQSRTDWVQTRTGLQAELVKLKTAIETQTDGMPGLEDVAQNTGILFDYVKGLDTALETTLDALLETSDGPQREKLKGEAIGIIATYRTTLDSDFFRAVDDNGFTATTLRSTALASLTGVETALAA